MTPILISSSLKYSDIRAELMPDVLPDRSEVAKFDQTKLKHVKTTEKVVLPTQDGETEICYSTATITKFKLTMHDKEGKISPTKLSVCYLKLRTISS